MSLSPNAEVYHTFLTRVDKALKPLIADWGYDCEYSVIETDRDMWKIQGLVPPMSKTAAEREWVTMNRAVPFEATDGVLRL